MLLVWQLACGSIKSKNKPRFKQLIIASRSPYITCQAGNLEELQCSFSGFLCLLTHCFCFWLDVAASRQLPQQCPLPFLMLPNVSTSFLWVVGRYFICSMVLWESLPGRQGGRGSQMAQSMCHWCSNFLFVSLVLIAVILELELVYILLKYRYYKSSDAVILNFFLVTTTPTNNIRKIGLDLVTT